MSFETDVRRQQGYYDDHWRSATQSAADRDRTAFTIAAIPKESKRILDVGCGDGRVSLALASSGCKVTALDLSTIALAHLAIPGVCASAENLPFPNECFDLILSTEALEHIPPQVYEKVLSEVARVAKQNILITVPNSENLQENFVKCGACGVRAHRWGHMRSYSKERLSQLFPGFKCLQATAFGEDVEEYNTLLLWVRQSIAGGWICDASDRCPACGAASWRAPRWSLLARACDAANSRLWAPFRKKPSWLLALYERVHTGSL